MKTSKKNIISIRKFVNNYLLEECPEDKKLTHGYLYYYFMENGLDVPKKARFSKITPTDILFANVLLVSDENNKVVAYYNPLQFNEHSLLHELQTERKEEIEAKRRDNITKQGYYVSPFGEIVDLKNQEPEEYEFQETNRHKKLINSRTRRKLC